MSTPVQTRIGQLTRLLASDKPGEVAAAAAALQRTLSTIGRDLNWAADTLMNALAEPQADPSGGTQSDADEWLPVDSLTLSRHEKADSVTVRVTYRVGSSKFYDWWAFEHPGAAREIAIERWFDVGGDMPAPRTVDQAIRRQCELSDEIEITVEHDGRYWHVTGQRLRQEMAA